jgi:hypothetical protein
MPTPKKEAAEDYGILIKMSVCASYMVASSSLTTINKALYEKFDFSSPLNLLLVQCFCNVLVCMSMMSYKTFVNP